MYQVEVVKMKQLAKISFHFVSNQYLMQISGIKFIMPILLVFYVMALQNWGLLKKIYIYILLVNPDTFKVKVAFLHSKMGYCKICRAFIQSLNQLSKTQFCSTYCLKLCFSVKIWLIWKISPNNKRVEGISLSAKYMSLKITRWNPIEYVEQDGYRRKNMVNV